jgi:hypothetical protein
LQANLVVLAGEEFATVADPIPSVDGLLAVTPRVHRLTLVKRNTRNCLGFGVWLLKPFEES